MADVAMSLDREVKQRIPAGHAAIAPWQQWKPTCEQPVPDVVRVGEAIVPETNESSVSIMPMPGSKHIQLYTKDKSAAMLKTLLLRAAGSYPQGSVKFWFADYIHGELNDFKDLGSDMLGYINRRQVSEKLAELAWLQECLVTGRAHEAGSLAAQRHILVLNGNIRLDDAARRHLDYLTVTGNQWGGVIAVDTELPTQNVQRNIIGGLTCRRDPSPPDSLIRLTAGQISGELQLEQDKPFTILDIDEGPIWGASIANGIELVMGKDVLTGQCPIGNLEDLPHVLIGGPTRRGKSVYLNGLVASIAKKYNPKDVEIMFMDGAGTAAALWASNGPDDPELPHASVLAGNLSVDPEYAMEVLLHLEATIKDRIDKTRGRGEKFADLKRYYPDMREIVLVWDEFDELLKDSQYGKIAAEKLMYLVQKGAKAGVHFAGATQHVHSIKALWGSIRGVTDQLGLRVAFNGGEHVMELTDNPGNYSEQIADIDRRRAWINNNYGRGPASHNVVVRVPDARHELVKELKRRLPSSPLGRRAAIYDGNERPVLAGMAEYRALTPGNTRSAQAFVGKQITIKGESAKVDFTDDYGSNLLVLGTKNEQIASVFRAAGQSLAKQHTPGTVEFTIVCCDSRQRDTAGRLASDLSHGGHEVTFVPDSQQAERFWQEVADAPASDDARKHYVLIYGADRLKSKAAGRILNQVVTIGPEQGIHTIMSASSLSAAEEYAINNGNAKELFESRLIIDGTPRDVSKLVDYGYQWNSNDRPGRAILGRDRGNAEVIRLFD
jgi:hypothetical protein